MGGEEQEGQMPHPQNVFYVRTVFFFMDAELKRGNLKSWDGGKECMYVKGRFRTFLT